MSDFLARLEKFLTERNEKSNIETLTPDASTREYFRVGWRGDSAIACVYPEPFRASEQSYLDVTNLFVRADLPVARIIDFDESLGVIVQEDLGDRILRDVLVEADEKARDHLTSEALTLIAKIQAATPMAFELDSIASRLRFDTEKLLWELEFFKTHYFTTYKGDGLTRDEDSTLTAEFRELSEELDSRARVLCHRDFHAANLMLDRDGRLRIIDHQDARIGSVAYDLVSFLLDRVTEPPSAEWLAAKRREFLGERERLGLERIDERAFAEEFRLQTIQRCLKAIGTFSYQSVNRGKTYFVPFIKPMFLIVLRALENLDRFPTMKMVIAREIRS
jgi:aminoglycoside/choline kinase family phosphotransferase